MQIAEAAYGIPEISVKMLHENEPDFFSDMVPVVLRAPSLNFKIEEMTAAKQNPPISRISKRFVAEVSLVDFFRLSACFKGCFLLLPCLISAFT